MTGELDLASRPQVLHVLRTAVQARPSALVVDLADVTFCDSSGLNALLRIRREAAAAGIPLSLARCSERVLRLLDITGADDIFVLHADLDSALS